MNLKVLILVQFVAIFMYLEMVEAMYRRSPRPEDNKFAISWYHDFNVHINVHDGNVWPEETRLSRTFYDCSDGEFNKKVLNSSIDSSYQNYEFKICEGNTNSKLYVHPHSE